MQTQQLHFLHNEWKTKHSSTGFSANEAQLVTLFGSREMVGQPQIYAHVAAQYPNAQIVSSSTAGEIIDEEVFDDSVIVTAMQFEKTRVKAIKTSFNEQTNSFETGKYLYKSLNEPDLAGLFILSDGTQINGSELVSGLNQDNEKKIPITGGLAGDAARFSQTLVGLNEPATEGIIVAVGFFGNAVKIGHSSLGGWDEFGKERVITKSDKNVLYEIDGASALDLYKEYLGTYADELPGSALLFPLSLRLKGSDQTLVRTILNVDNANKTMTFAGNLPEGSKVRFMKANFEKLIKASSSAAEKSFQTNKSPDLAILISCVGRKLILQERTEDEVVAAKQIFGEDTCITGFYSYGEISPFNTSFKCELHNQTMTITTFSEQ
ncbi:MAG: histidine kinase [Bacteroidetes bacterium 24-39-8]|jgi:hypothetical protein|nr:MAG: histidine kinase [Bacteroidetes bacterium 24-39-8]OZA66542.1 MAG: histidine kinase [Sphingobacteriia bacterium 39-39-8]HQR91853.1 FIST N-terminal domain-containing protein [Sediminibacterium sp.]HQS55080.1 FIST N-terminal domain-containing protein [Sediminibacterium sp.]